jgi:hypothetical protein
LRRSHSLRDIFFDDDDDNNNNNSTISLKMARWTRAIVFLAATTASASAFVVPKHGSNHVVGSTPTTRFGNTQQPAQADDPITTVFGEESRRYRRTVFSHDDWVRHRSPDRFWRNVKTFFR